MPSLSKTASAAVAALVVSGAAVVVPLLGPGWQGAPRAGAAPSGATSPTATPSSPSRSPSDEASALPAGGGGAAVPRTVLFVGDSAALRPKAGSAVSYACRAATSLGLRCAVRSRTATTPVRADLVVLVMAPQDDATTLAAALDALPAGAAGVPGAVLEPVAVSTSRTVAGHLPDIRRLATARHLTLVDPVAQRWVTAATRHTYLAADGVQPTAAGVTYLAGRLAQSLAPLAP